MDNTRYPIGTQSFEILRNDGCVYVDKTAYVYELTHSGSRTYFLSRPRRFGKSLLLSTFEAYFRGRKELFEGLAIYDKEKEWTSYPVLHIDLSRAEAADPKDLKRFIHNRLHEFEQQYAVTNNDQEDSVGDRFGMLITNVAAKEGKQVVILIDEYDKGIIEVLDNERNLKANQSMLQPFFSQIKALNAHIRFCFITGVARFRHYTLFSGFNNPNDISMDDAYADICGITIDELTSNFQQGINALSQKQGWDFSETVEALKTRYDNYRFTDSEVLVFNPFSILNCLQKRKISNYWIKSGTSKIFLNYLSGTKLNVTDIDGVWVTSSRMEAEYSKDDPIPLLYQTGYLTIGATRKGRYQLCIPNGEVKSALVEELLPKYMGINTERLESKLLQVSDMIETGDVNGFLTEVKVMLTKVPYHEIDFPNIEKYYHLMVYQIFLMLGIDARSEIAISGGRIDMVAMTKRYVYVMEFKLDGTAQQALEQIDRQGYALPWVADGREVIKMGINFSPETRTIDNWEISRS